ncbi:MAG TPA: hypothetical protein VIJ00_19275, partial [Nakamurella sp.]
RVPPQHVPVVGVDCGGVHLEKYFSWTDLGLSVTDHFVQYLPSNLGGVLTGSTSGLAHPFAPWTGFGVLCGYAVVLVAFAAWRLRRVDA